MDLPKLRPPGGGVFILRRKSAIPDKHRQLSADILWISADNKVKRMDYTAIIQQVIDRIEDKVKDDIRVEQLASEAGFSKIGRAHV